jgi:16S rRNA (uracil1498-N3)-methyltransferase
VARRIHVPVLRTGELLLDASQAHHVRAVLRLTDGAAVEVFDDGGNIASGTLAFDGARGAVVRVEQIDLPSSGAGTDNDPPRWSVAAAVPKGERADWMVEKLSELGCAAFIPLATARSVVLPEGRNKRDRWARIAAESAKQSRRRGVMRIEELTPLAELLARQTAGDRGGDAGADRRERPPHGWFLSTQPDAIPARLAIDAGLGDPFLLAIGPEGGWTSEELAAMSAAGLTPVGLTRTILRVETAAVVAGAIVATMAAVPASGRTATAAAAAPPGPV